MKKIIKIFFYKYGIYDVLKKIRIIKPNVIKIDGGLGSQLISFMQFYCKIHTNNSVKVDTSFFNIPVNSNIFHNNATYRKWKLDYYGINKDQYFQKYLISNKFSFLTTSLNDQMENLKQFLSSDFRSFNWDNILPINTNTLNDLYKIINFNEVNYAVIHIRRGDFLKFSSHIVDDKKIINFLKQINHLMPHEIFIMSDDIFDEIFSKDLTSIFESKNLHFISGGDEILMHALMRNSSFLVTSNSMYSLSAAILQRKGGVSVIPNQFYGVEFSSYNDFINLVTDWSFLKTTNVI